MLKVLHICLTVCYIFGLANFVNAQIDITDIDDEQWEALWNDNNHLIFNHPKSPVSLKINKNMKYVRLDNKSSEAVNKIWFGCVKVDDLDNSSFKVYQEFLPKYFRLYKDTKIKPKNDLLFGSELSGISECIKTKRKIAITKILFEDKSEWYLESVIKNKK